MTIKRIVAPAGMSEQAKKRFRRLIKDLPDRWQPHHVDALALYCETYEQVSKLQREFAATEEIVIQGGKGQPQISPLWGPLKEGTVLVQKLGSDLGLFSVCDPQSQSETARTEVG